MQTDQPDTLDAIRQAETEVTRRLTMAQEAAHSALDDARREAEDTQNMAEERGRVAGEKARQTAIVEARARAAEMVAEARNRTENMREIPQTEKAAAVERIVALIRGRKEGRDEA